MKVYLTSSEISDLYCADPQERRNIASRKGPTDLKVGAFRVVENMKHITV
jgi:hypothetical protein